MTRILYLLAAIVLLAAGVATAALAGGQHPDNGCKYKHDCETTTTTPPPTQTTPPPTTPPPTTTTPPSGHNCTNTGAGKDGQPGNDDCASVPPKTPPATVPPTAPPVTQTVTVTVPTPPTVITKTVIKYKTRTIYKTRYKDRIVRKTIILRRTCGCPVGTKLYKGKCHPTIPGKG